MISHGGGTGRKGFALLVSGGAPIEGKQAADAFLLLDDIVSTPSVEVGDGPAVATVVAGANVLLPAAGIVAVTGGEADGFLLADSTEGPPD